jgi:hypothetical protein
MVNLYESVEHAAIREDLRKRLVEWMILERDHLPLPLKPGTSKNRPAKCPYLLPARACPGSLEVLSKVGVVSQEPWPKDGQNP